MSTLEPREVIQFVDDITFMVVSQSPQNEILAKLQQLKKLAQNAATSVHVSVEPELDELQIEPQFGSTQYEP